MSQPGSPRGLDLGATIEPMDAAMGKSHHVRAYYLTEASFALASIALRRMKIARYLDSNDPFELLGADRSDPLQRRLLELSRTRSHEQYGMLCFSRGWHDPVLWSHYADRHRGICLGFDVARHLLSTIKYIKTPIPPVPLKGHNPTPREATDFFGLLLRVKSEGWRYEREIRASVRLDPKTAEGGLYFMPFSPHLRLRQVFLGARCTLPLDAVRELAIRTDSSVEVFQTRLAFRSFRVVKNRRST